MRVFTALALVLMLAVGGAASPITWTLSPLHLIQSSPIPPGATPATGTITGSFTYDADTNTYSNWSFLFSGFSPYSILPLTPATSTLIVVKSPGLGDGCPGTGPNGTAGPTPDPCSVIFSSNSPGANYLTLSLSLDFSPQLTNAGGTATVPYSEVSLVGLDSPRYVSFQRDSTGTVSTNAPRTSALAHYAVGGSFATGFFVTNTAGQPAQFSISAFSDNGTAASLPFNGLSSLSTLSDTIPPYGMTYYEAGTPQAQLQGGWGLVTADQSITVQALFRNHGADGSYYEAAVPPSTGSKEFVVPFDMTKFTATGDQIYIGLAIANLDAVSSATVVCTARDSKGNAIPNAVSPPLLNPRGHWADYAFPLLNGMRGTLDCSSNTTIAAIGLRFLGNNTFSSLPIILK